MNERDRLSRVGWALLAHGTVTGLLAFFIRENDPVTASLISIVWLVASGGGVLWVMRR